MSSIDGSQPINPNDRKLYEQDYMHGVDLFQRALAEYSKSQEPHQKEAFREVMDKAMQALNETAQGLKRQDLLKQNGQIQQDLTAFEKSGSDAAKDKLASDLNQAKESL